MHPTRDRVVISELDARRLDLVIRVLAIVATGFGIVDVVLGVALGRPGVMAAGVVAFVGGTWLGWEAHRQGSDGRQRVIARMTIVQVVLSVVAAAFQPEVAAGAALATLLPVIVAAPYVDQPRLRSLMIFVGAAGILCAVLGRASFSNGDSLIGLALSLPGFIASYLIILLVLSGVATQLKSSADDLRSVVAMSSDLSQTLDPDRMATRSPSTLPAPSAPRSVG